MRIMADDIARPLLDDAPLSSMPKALIAGVVAALVGAAIWGGIEVLTGYQIGWIAIGIGFLCGFAVRFAGKGTGMPFRVVGATCALLGCALGALWAFDHELSKELTKRGMEGLEFGLMDKVQMMRENTGPMTWVIFAIAVFQGWKFSVDDSIPAAATSETKLADS
jgi:hypothetical protein